MELNLSTWQRVILITILNKTEAGFGALRIAGDILKQIEMAEEEKQAIGLTVSDDQISWRPNDTVWTLEISDEQAQFLGNIVCTYNRWPVTQRAQVFDLAKQLGVLEGK